MKITRRLRTRSAIVCGTGAFLIVLGLRLIPGAPAGSPTHVDAGTQNAIVVPAGPATTTSSARPPTSPATSTPAPAGTSRKTTTPGGTDPVLVQPTGAPGAQEAATEFAAAWLNTYQQSPDTWRADLTKRVTADEAAELAAADPGSVPAGAMTGPVTLGHADGVPVAAAPIITADDRRTPLGTLKLTMVQQRGAWLVSQIDWEPRR